MLDLVKEALDHVLWGILVILLIVWWVGGPAVTAIVWSGGDKRLALQFLGVWAAVTALYLAASRLIRRTRRRSGA
ncbi:hypothetical protein ACHBTE_27450 [Streptomyces sp. M41]|uniref:hypothetical protein n=1 Tax=Streptomyces sp. M41 TaxID=3059412 RepID=UPI00374CFDA0